MPTNNADDFTNPISVNTGGTGLDNLTNHAVEVGNGTSPVTQVLGTGSQVLIGNTGADPSFSATPNVTSITLATGTALSTYAEGTWTPTIDGSVSGTTTYTTQQGYYIRVGNIVVIDCLMVITGATGTGNAQIEGFPFLIRNQTNGRPEGAAMVSGWAWPTSTTSISLVGILNTGTANVGCSGAGVAQSQLVMSNSACTFRFNLAYEI